MMRSFGTGEDPAARERAMQWVRMMHPPENVSPGVVPLGGLLARTADAAVAVEAIAVYPGGLSLTLVSRLRRKDDIQAWRNERMMPGRSTEVFLGAEYADGRRASSIDHFDPERFDSADNDVGSPRLVSGSGGGDGGRFDSRYWLAPLPADGDLTLVCTWEAQAIIDARMVLPLADITDAASRPVELWPLQTDDQPYTPAPPTPPSSGWFSQT